MKIGNTQTKALFGLTLQKDMGIGNTQTKRSIWINFTERYEDR